MTEQKATHTAIRDKGRDYSEAVHIFNMDLSDTQKADKLCDYGKSIEVINAQLLEALKRLVSKNPAFRGR